MRALAILAAPLALDFCRDTPLWKQGGWKFDWHGKNLRAFLRVLKWDTPRPPPNARPVPQLHTFLCPVLHVSTGGQTTTKSRGVTYGG